MNAKMITALLSVAVCIGSTSGCRPTVWLEQEQTVSLSIDAVSQLLAKTHNGRVRIHASDAESIDATIHLRVGGTSASDANNAMQAIDIITNKVNGVQHLSWDWGQTRRPSWAAVISFDVTLPAHISVKARTHNGPIEVSGIDSDCSMRTHNGSISAQHGNGTMHARTHNGSIKVKTEATEATFETHNGRITAELTQGGPISGSFKTHNGSIEVTLDDQATARVSCKTHNGRIRHAMPLIEKRTTKRSVSGVIGEDHGSLRFKTHNGSINIL